MQRKFRGIILLGLAMWMIFLTFVVLYRFDWIASPARASLSPASVPLSAPVSVPASGPQDIVVAARTLERGTVLALDMIKPETRSVQDLPPDYIGYDQRQVYQDHVLLARIKAGEPLLKYRLASGPQQIAVAARPLVAGVRLTPDMITSQARASNDLPEDFILYEKRRDYIGHVILAGLEVDEPFLTYKLHRNREALIEERTQKSMRAMAVKVDSVIGVSGYIKPYSRVDVLVTLNPTSKRPRPETRTVLENVLVLASGSKTERDDLADLPAIKQEGRKQSPTRVDVVTLQVSPSDAEKLAFASSNGRLWLALRNPLDTSKTQTTGATRESLLISSTTPTPASRFRKVRIEVIKGVKKEKTSFVVSTNVVGKTAE